MDNTPTPSRKYRVTLSRYEKVTRTFDVEADNRPSAIRAAEDLSTSDKSEEWTRTGKIQIASRVVVRCELISGATLGDRIVEDLLYDPSKDQVLDTIGEAQLHHMTAESLRYIVDRAHEAWLLEHGIEVES